jgi:hypothetical protein
MGVRRGRRDGMVPPTHTFTAPDGRTYRVRDVCFGLPPSSPGRALRLPLGDARATSRVFVPTDTDSRKEYLFRSYRLGDDRAVDDATLAAQLHQCAWWDTRPIEETQRRDLGGATRYGG